MHVTVKRLAGMVLCGCVLAGMVPALAAGAEAEYAGDVSNANIAEDCEIYTSADGDTVFIREDVSRAEALQDDSYSAIADALF